MTATRPYVQVARAASRDRTRAALLDATEEAFFARPWEQVSLESIAADAGVTKQTLLRHFGSKEGLLEAGSARAIERVREQRLSAPTDDLEAAVDNLLEHYEDLGDRALRLEAMEGDPAVANIVERGREFHGDWVDHAFGAWLDAARGRDRARRRGALIALCDVHTWRILSRDLGLPRSEVRATLISTIRRILEEQT
jgi:AcrR family transcriptional regulator